MNHNRNLRRLAAVATLVVAGAAGTAFAHPHPDGEGEGKKVERIVIVRDGAKGEHRAGAGDHRHVRTFALRGHGPLIDCDGGEKVVDDGAGEGDKKTKVVVCTKGKTSAETAQHLEEALARITANDDLSDEQKARIATALRSAIDRARSTR